MPKLLEVELFFVMFIIFIESGLSFNCYQCRSDEEKACSNNLSISYSKECQNGTHCRKIQQKLKFKHERYWTIIRECALSAEKDECYHFKWLDIAYQEIYECDTENCNHGSSHISDIFTIAIVLSLVWIFNYLKANNTCVHGET